MVPHAACLPKLFWCLDAYCGPCQCPAVVSYAQRIINPPFIQRHTHSAPDKLYNLLLTVLFSITSDRATLFCLSSRFHAAYTILCSSYLHGAKFIVSIFRRADIVPLLFVFINTHSYFLHSVCIFVHLQYENRRG